MRLTIAADKVSKQRVLLNAIRDQKELEPVEVTFSLGTVSIDCDSKSEARIKDALSYVDTVTWVLADNTSLDMDNAQLQELYEAMLVARGSRSLSLHTYTTGLKATLPVDDSSDIFDAALWDL